MNVIKFDSNTTTSTQLSKQEFFDQTSSVPQTAKIAFLRGSQDVLRDGNLFYTLDDSYVFDVQKYCNAQRALNLKTFSYQPIPMFRSKNLEFSDEEWNLVKTHFEWPFVSNLEFFEKHMQRFKDRVAFERKKDASGVLNIFSVCKLLKQSTLEQSIVEKLREIENLEIQDVLNKKFKLTDEFTLEVTHLPNMYVATNNRLYIEKSPFLRNNSQVDLFAANGTYLFSTKLSKKGDFEYSWYMFFLISRPELIAYFICDMLRDHFLRGVFNLHYPNSVYEGLRLNREQLKALLESDKLKSKLKSECLVFPHLQIGHRITIQMISEMYHLNSSELVDFLTKYVKEQKSAVALRYVNISPATFRMLSPLKLDELLEKEGTK